MLGTFGSYFRSVSPWMESSTADHRAPSKPDSLAAFVHAVTDKLEADTASLAPGRGIPLVKGLFNSYIASLQDQFACSPESPHLSRDQPQLVAVLDHLEALCQWPACGPRPHKHSNTFDPEQFPTLNSLLGANNSAKPAIEAFARAKADRNRAACTLWKQLIDAFEDLSAPENDSRGLDLSQLQKSAAVREEYEDNQAFILNLYNALSTHFKSGLCQYQRNSIIVNLRLNWWCKEVVDDTVTLCFGLFFTDSQATVDSIATCRWQDIQIAVPIRRVVGFQGPPTAVAYEPDMVDTTCACCDSDDASSDSDEDDLDHFCQLLESCNQSQLKFTYSTSFEYRDASLPTRPFRRSSLSVPLSKLVGRNKLTVKMKLVLSSILVHTLWQYYNSDWMGEDWSKETVHFMFDEEEGLAKVVSIHEPFLQTRFYKSEGNAQNQSLSGPDISRSKQKRKKQELKLKARTRTHPYPKLLALGIMLLEIELDKRFEDFPFSHDYFDSDAVNVRHAIANKTLRNNRFWQPEEILAPLRQTIEFCIKPDTEVLGTDESLLRDNFLERVVGPFKSFVSQAWPDQKANPVTIEDAPSRSRRGDHVQAHTSDADPELGHTAELHMRSTDSNKEPAEDASTPTVGHTLSDDSPITVNEWFSKLDDLNYILKTQASMRDQQSQPVKVAILDTGVSEQYYKLQAKHIKAYKDFASRNDGKRQDGTGHGTSCVQLLQKVYEDAQIYIGRVFERSNANDSTKSLMAEAIRYAITEWDVDVICLPSGFATRSDAIEDAIGDAVHAKVLVFTAASNLSNSASIFFPALLFQTFQVFCLFSTNAGVKPTCAFNPGAIETARFNFAILGEGIELPPLDGKPISKSHKGTSFSTIIAASVAAQVLDFSRRADVRGKIHDKRGLRQVDGMSAVFAQMVFAKENNYHCLAPWKLLGGMAPETHSEEEIRDEICSTISTALKMRYQLKL